MRLQFPVCLIGEISQETWPAYLSDLQYVDAVIGVIATCDFRVVTQCRSYPGDRLVRFTVGDSRSSRKMALHLDDPRGVVYILEDDGEAWDENSPEPPVVEPTKAVTLGELFRDSHPGVRRHLELNRHSNYRLASPSEMPAQITSPDVVWN